MSFENKNFCETCGSLNNIIRNEDTLNYYCTNCKFKSEKTVDKLVFEKIYNDSYKSDNIRFNKNIIYDRTLPRVNIKCKNPDCTATPENNEVIYLRYNEQDMKYIYVCVNCLTNWTNE